MHDAFLFVRLHHVAPGLDGGTLRRYRLPVIRRQPIHERKTWRNLLPLKSLTTFGYVPEDTTASSCSCTNFLPHIYHRIACLETIFPGYFLTCTRHKHNLLTAQTFTSQNATVLFFILPNGLDGIQISLLKIVFAHIFFCKRARDLPTLVTLANVFTLFPPFFRLSPA